MDEKNCVCMYLCVSLLYIFSWFIAFSLVMYAFDSKHSFFFYSITLVDFNVRSIEKSKITRLKKTKTGIFSECDAHHECVASNDDACNVMGKTTLKCTIECESVEQKMKF